MRLSSLLLLLLLLLLCVSPAWGQDEIHATTDGGKRVVLYPNGSWRYLAVDTALPEHTGTLEKPESATERIATPVDAFGVWIDPDTWTQASTEEPNRCEFYHNEGDAYAVIIAERIGMPLEAMKGVAISNARQTASQLDVTVSEHRVVNGTEVLHMQLDATVDGIPFVFLGYYYAGSEGSIQVITYTAQNLIAEYRADFFGFLNGLEITS